MILPDAAEELMSQPQVARQMHIHIRWEGVKRLDWEPFETREQAESRAKELVHPGESFVVEEHGKSCIRCASKLSAAS